MRQIRTSAQFVGFKFLVVSLFSGMGGLDTGLARSGMTIAYANDANFQACLIHMANFKHDDGTPVMTPFIEIDEETYKSIKANEDTQDYCGIIDGKYYRTRLIQEITGQEIRKMVEQRYGKKVIIILAGGPPCQEMSFMSINARKGKTNPTGKNSRHLVLEFSRVSRELLADAICMEEVEQLKLPENKDVYDKMMEELNALPYNIIENELYSCHHGGAQIRKRYFILALHAKYKTMPVFPEPDISSAKRVKDVLPYVAYFSSEQFTDKIKTSNYVLCTITRGTPHTFWGFDGRKWTPTIRELMKFVGFDDNFIIPEGIPDSQVRLAIGNTVCTYLAEAIGRSLIKSITDALRDGDPDQVENNPIGPVDPTEGADTDNTDSNNSGNDKEQTDGSPEPDQKFSSGLMLGRRVMPEKLNYRTLPDLRPDISDADDYAYERPRVEVIYNGSKIISSLDLLKMDHDVLSFTGAWHGFLGEPSTTFHMALYGCAGQGKSTFAIQFANYLADNFGKVIYVSGEEGFAMTFQKKFIDYQAASPNLDVADLRTCAEFEKMVPLDTYKFIFVDSLNTMQISPTKLRALKLKHKGCAFITISQVTKAGDARGSYEIMHDSDLIVEVIGGKAITIKNRFLSTGKVYSVFRRNDHHS